MRGFRCYSMLSGQPLPAPGSRKRYASLQGSSDALALAQLAGQKRPLIILTETAADAQRLHDEIPYFAPALSVHLLPDWETLPYDQFSPHQDLISERLATLYQISQNACDVAIIPATTALYRLPPREFLAAHTFFLKQGAQLDLDALRGQLTLAGYTHVTQVISPGEYSVRGGIVDLFPMGSPLPYRIDLFDNEIESIRTFDADTQRSIYPVKDVRLLPAREFPLDKIGQDTFRRNFREKFEGDPSKSRLYKDVSAGLAPPGIEYYLPLFFESTATLFDYLPQDTLICQYHGLELAAQTFWRDTQSRYQLLRGDRDRPLLPPQELFLPVETLFAALKPYPRIELSADTQDSALPLPSIQVDRRADNPVSRLQQFVADFDGRILLLAESLGRRETMLQFLAEHGLKPVPCETYADFQGSQEKFMLGVGPLNAGFVLPSLPLAPPHPSLAFITESELYATQVRQIRRRDAARKSTVENMLRDLSEVRINDPVVHEQHGIGRYLGLVSLDLGEGETEFLLLEYAGGDKLYVPVSHLHLIGRYSGASPESAPLHKLGSGQWEKSRKKALKQARDTAAELLNLYAQRAARQGHVFKIKQRDYEAFAASFEFEETPDQAAAIQAVIEDMTAGKPMDRLICGDVGFGKTEVALRAAFVAVADGKQVAILVPTTLLAEQHFQNFSDRFAEFPIKIAELSRFRSAKEQTEALKGMAEGKIDIVIGTHKLIQKDIKFKNLGLVIVDEEHRFGVRQKERLKALRAEVDVLTLTATPIPRTLSMSLEGLRDFSVIATPPQRRLSIKTFVSPDSDGVIREAVLRELKRGGQIYFLHNEVETILNVREKLAKLLPEARIAVAHGQLRERELEHVMRDFYQQRFNLLLCSTIIETGIDIPTANTIIIHRADKFGLAQLHQLRGRVGRSHHQAYAYLLTPPGEEGITPQARKRLDAIQSLEDLGAGFYLSMHDLEIRGAGEILGESQSGEMQEIGFNLYTEMLNRAVKALKAGKEPDIDQPLGITTEINLHSPALLPNDYCGDVNERLTLYKRLANCASLEELDQLHEELIDRFGLLPSQASALLDTHRLRILAKPLGIIKIDASSGDILLQFIPNPPIDPVKIIQMIQSKPGCKLAGPDRLKISREMPEVKNRMEEIVRLLKELG
ncbi:MAG: transcription-repair coupling factor [Hydrogenophilales bacterium CG_4_9_14_3_um_filter_59_35]|nr:MAG: transcription-repair coupling factor [Hydrogenophilales bacterium CG18_big_fil_WC_8_21_14_2_50_58_12]PIY00360.1 MAG: transcription-repair coupling factor [Hydrogenophilales bacterium CG_4_10_14_3_um_filter_58_23]PJB07886.1 MAG: transcription-repair coupling factor [Hydrogenophilales bacterium CG_4_9_14_3_um_filter_59_35]